MDLEDKPVGCVKVVEERYVTTSDINTMAARLLKAELSRSTVSFFVSFSYLVF